MTLSVSVSHCFSQKTKVWRRSGRQIQLLLLSRKAFFFGGGALVREVEDRYGVKRTWGSALLTRGRLEFLGWSMPSAASVRGRSLSWKSVNEISFVAAVQRHN